MKLGISREDLGRIVERLASNVDGGINIDSANELEKLL